MATRTNTAKKTKKQPKPMPPCRIFFGGELYHEALYDEKNRSQNTMYHNDGLTGRFEETLTRRLTQAAKEIVAENPDTGMFDI